MRRELGVGRRSRSSGPSGGTEPQKRFDLLLDVFGPLSGRTPWAASGHAGDGSLRSELERRAKRWELARRAGLWAIAGRGGSTQRVRSAGPVVVLRRDAECRAGSDGVRHVPLLRPDVGGTREVGASRAGGADRATAVDTNACAPAIVECLDNPTAALQRAAPARPRASASCRSTPGAQIGAAVCRTGESASRPSRNSCAGSPQAADSRDTDHWILHICNCTLIRTQSCHTRSIPSGSPLLYGKRLAFASRHSD